MSFILNDFKVCEIGLHVWVYWFNLILLFVRRNKREVITWRYNWRCWIESVVVLSWWIFGFWSDEFLCLFDDDDEVYEDNDSNEEEDVGRRWRNVIKFEFFSSSHFLVLAPLQILFFGFGPANSQGPSTNFVFWFWFLSLYEFCFFGFGPSTNFVFWFWSLSLCDSSISLLRQHRLPRHTQPRHPPFATCAFCNGSWREGRKSKSY